MNTKKAADYRNHPAPAEVREHIKELELLAKQHCTEGNLVHALKQAEVYLNRYNMLLEAMYLNSLHRCKIDFGPLETD